MFHTITRLGNQLIQRVFEACYRHTDEQHDGTEDIRDTRQLTRGSCFHNSSRPPRYSQAQVEVARRS